MIEKTKIAYLLTPIDFGGAEKVSLNFLKAVDREKFSIVPIVFIRPWEKDNLFLRFLESEGYVYYKVPVAVKPVEEGRDLFRILRCWKIIYSILRSASCHLIHTNGYFADFIGVSCAKYFGIPCVSTCHGFVPQDKKIKLYGFLDRIVLRYCTKIIAVSEDLKKQLIQSRIREDKIRIIQNAVPQNCSSDNFLLRRKSKREEIGICGGQLVLGYVGRLSEEKGVKYLIEACSIIKNNNMPFRLIVVGEGPEKQELEEIARRKGIIANVYFAGFQKDIGNWLAALDIFVLPSLTEGTPLALLEAMSVKLPVIASAVGGVPKIIKNMKNGILVSPANPDQIADATIKLYTNNELRSEMARKAAETIETQFSINDWVAKIESVYLDIMAAQAGT